MSSTRSTIAPPPFAANALTVIPPTPVAGVSYRDPAAGPASSADGWPYAERVNSAEFNQIMFQVSTLLSIIDLKGVLGWTNLKDYSEAAIVFGSDGALYKWVQPSGPSGIGAKDPVSEPAYWALFTEFLNSARINVASAATVNLTTAAPNTRHINITGGGTINGFTVAAGNCYIVRFDAAGVLTNSASLVTQSGANINTAAGDTCMIRSTAANVVEILCYTPGIPQELGYRQTLQNVLGSRAINTTYTNNTGRTIWVLASINIASGTQPLLALGGASSGSFGNNGSGANVVMYSFPVLNGQDYRINGGTSAAYWSEIR